MAVFSETVSSVNGFVLSPALPEVSSSCHWQVNNFLIPLPSLTYPITSFHWYFILLRAFPDSFIFLFTQVLSDSCGRAREGSRSEVGG